MSLVSHLFITITNIQDDEVLVLSFLILHHNNNLIIIAPVEM